MKPKDPNVDWPQALTFSLSPTSSGWAVLASS